MTHDSASETIAGVLGGDDSVQIRAGRTHSCGLLPETGLVPSDLDEVMRRVVQEQQAHHIRPTDRFTAIPQPTRTQQ